MSTVAEIRAALPNLTTEELRSVESALLQQYRHRKVGVIYNDAYGIWTEDDQDSVAAEMFTTLDNQEKQR